MNQEYPSALLERAVKEFTKLPGIGRKTATRLVLHLLRKREDEVAGFIDECHEPIMSALRGNNPHLTAHQLPGIPRKNPKKIEE